MVSVYVLCVVNCGYMVFGVVSSFFVYVRYDMLV